MLNNTAQNYLKNTIHRAKMISIYAIYSEYVGVIGTFKYATKGKYNEM